MDPTAGRSFFAAYAHPGEGAKSDDDVAQSKPYSSSPRWNRIARPHCGKRRRSYQEADEAVQSTGDGDAKKGRSRTTSARETVSFGAVTASNFTINEAGDDGTATGKALPQIHTLLLGTHPSIKSLEESQYYGHPMNAFWWIAGDCLGFRRAEGVSESTGKPYQLAGHLRHDTSKMLPYEQQVRRLCSKGFALWDIVRLCERPGSLDQDITKDVPNDIRGFCQKHPSIKRIVFSNGGTGCAFFKKHFKDWLGTGELVPGRNKASRDALKKWAKNGNNNKDDPTTPGGGAGRIECIVALAVSPAAARYSYEEKRDFWEEWVYRPGLKDFESAEQEARR